MIKEYDRQSAVAYAKKWALDKNPSFYYFDDLGGDCTNFVSQCLLAGGGIMNFDKYYGWFYKNSFDRSPSWTGVEYLKQFLLSKKQYGVFAEMEKLDKLDIGDIIQLKQELPRFSHSLIITKIENNEIFVSAHSIPALDRPLKTYDYVDIIGLKIKGSITLNSH